jgi:mRNA-degrading endonuclease RelE of RelBE toxin-antitoxin system
MTTIEIKTEITKELERLPENALKNVLNYIKTQLNRTEEEAKHDRSVERIIANNTGLFERLAK